MFEKQKLWVLKKLGKTNIQKLEKARRGLQGRPFTIEIDGRRISFNKHPVRGGKLYWGDGLPTDLDEYLFRAREDEEGNSVVYERDFHETELKDALFFSDDQRPVYLCVRGIPFSLNPNKVFTLTDSGLTLINWQVFSSRLSALVDGLDVVSENQARMELVGMGKKLKVKKEWVIAALLLGLVAVVAYVVFVNPHLVPSFMSSMGRATGSVLRPR